MECGGHAAALTVAKLTFVTWQSAQPPL